MKYSSRREDNEQYGRRFAFHHRKMSPQKMLGI